MTIATEGTVGEGLAVRPTRVRNVALLFVSSLAVLTYVDRVCIAQAAPTIQKEFRLNDQEMGLVFSAFAWGYAIFEVPGGWLGDRIGARKVLTRIVLWWSFFTAATGWAWNLMSLAATRFLFGAGEAGCFPNVAKALKSWFPEGERVQAQSIVWLSARWGGAFTPMLVVLMLHYVSWQGLVALFGAVGILWAFLFYKWYRDNPRDLASMNEAELAIIEGGKRPSLEVGPTPWGRMAASPSLWLLCLQYMCLTYSWIFYVTFLPKYLMEDRGVDRGMAALLAALPLFFGGFGCLASGFLSVRVSRWTGSMSSARRLLACFGFGASSALLLVSLYLKHPVPAMIAMGLAGFANDFVMPVSWAVCMDLGGRHVGTLSGVMNTSSAIAGAIAPLITGAILQRTGGNWAIPLYISAAVYGLGFLCWLFIDPVTPLVKPEGEPA